MVSENKGNPFVDLFFFVLQEVISVNFTGLWKPTLYNLVIISRLFKWWRKSPSLCFVVSTVEHIRFTLMAWLNGILLKQCLGWQLLGERYWCLSVGLENKSVVMLPSLAVVVVSRKDILVFDISCVNFVDGWILLACSKNSSSSLSLCIHFMSTSSINRNHERGCLSDERSNRSSRSPIKMLA
jgi:hypothetical protein